MLTRLNRSIVLFALCGLAFVLGCGGGLGSKTNFRVMNAVPDQTNINVLLDGTSIESTVAYGTASTYTQTKSGSRHLQVEPSTGTAVFLDEMFNLAGGTNSTVIVANTSTSSSGIVLTDNNTAPTTTGNIQIRIVNASPTMGTVDVYVVPPNTNISGITPSVSSLGFESASAYLNLTAGSYDIVFTPPGSTFATLNVGSVSFSAGQNRTIVALNNLTGGFSIATLIDLN